MKSDKTDKQVPLPARTASKAPEPISPLKGIGGSAVLSRQRPFEPIDWPFWLAMEDVRLWEACALSLDIDPRSLKISRTSWMAGDGQAYFETGSFENKEIQDLFERRRELLTRRLHKFKSPYNPMLVNLLAFSRWWPVSVGELPRELQSFKEDQQDLGQSVLPIAPALVTGKDGTIPIADVELAPLPKIGNHSAKVPEADLVKQDALISAFGCDPNFFKESKKKFPDIFRARVKPGKAGRGGHPALWDPGMFGMAIIGTSYVRNMTEKRVFEILKSKFPDVYPHYESYESNSD